MSPAILIVGDVVTLNRTLSWVEKEKPLLGRTVVVTRPEQQSHRLIDLLEDKGAYVIPCPVMSIEAIKDESSRAAVEKLRQKTLSYDWFVFLSENGVRSFHQLIGPDSAGGGRES